LLLALIFEWIMGNFLSMMIMGMFAVFWLSFGVLETPSWAIAASYSPTGDAAEGAASKGYNAAVALYLLVWGFWLFTTWIFTLKTNTVFAAIFFFAFISSFLFSGAYWKVSTGDYGMAMKLQKVKIHFPTQFPRAQADEIRLAGQHSSFSPFLDIILPLS
jgi:succinate-acetate transporter protein